MKTRTLRCWTACAPLMLLAALGHTGEPLDDRPGGAAGAPAGAPAADPSAPPASPASPAPSAAPPAIALDRVFAEEKWVRPTGIVARPDDGDRLYVLEQGGRIRAVRRSVPDAKAVLFMDIDDRVNFATNEEGLLSVAFHPRFAENRQFVVYYSAEKPRRSVLSRFTAIPAEGAAKEAGLDLVGDPASEEVLLEVAQPYWNHNGGTALFGPDGMLWLSLGDGGAANDPHGAGQDLGTLLAKVIRIDIDRRDGERRYAIPSDNPFVERSGARPEIWAFGLRNVWRMSFDRVGGALWAGDVGQNRWEEINRIERGGNYGWNLREGRHAFTRGGAERGDTIDPSIEYPRADGLSVTGGHVYRGARYPALQGVYLYADYASGTVWGARVTGAGLGTPKVVFRKQGRMISSFGEANDGELYVTTFEGSEQGPGALFRIVAK